MVDLGLLRQPLQQLNHSLRLQSPSYSLWLNLRIVGSSRRFVGYELEVRAGFARVPEFACENLAADGSFQQIVDPTQPLGMPALQQNEVSGRQLGLQERRRRSNVDKIARGLLGGGR